MARDSSTQKRREGVPYLTDTETLTAGSVSTEEGPNKTLNAESFDGATGADKIQNALDDAASESGLTKVIAGASPVDDLSGYSTADRDSGWLLDSRLDVGADTILQIDGYLFVDDGVDDIIIANKGINFSTPSNSTSKSNIYIIGEGHIDGNAANQAGSPDSGQGDYTRTGLHFFKVDNLNIGGGLTVGPTDGWGIVPEECTDVTVDGIHLNQDGSQANQDGVHVTGCTEVVVSNVTGQSSDDAVAAACDEPLNIGSGADCERVSFSQINVTIESNSSGGLFRTAPKGSFAVRHVSIDNSYGYDCEKAIRIGFSGNGTAANHENITVSNTTVYAKGANGVLVDAPVADLTVENLNAYDCWNLFETNSHTADGLTISGCEGHKSVNHNFDRGMIEMHDAGGNGAEIIDCTIEDCRLFDNGQSTSAGVRFLGSLSNLENVRIEDVRVHNSPEGVNVESSVPITDSVQVSDIRTTNVTDKFLNMPREEISVNGTFAKALAGAAPSTSDYNIGDEVEDTDNSGDVYKILSSGATQIGT